ncbi:MAG: hypothetical protein ABJB12_08980 [Pseudomonadota bacterium]
MPTAVTLVIYVSTALAADPGSAILRHSAQEILGDQAQVTLRASTTEVSDDTLSAQGTEADAVADVAWLNDEHRRATVRCYVGKLGRIVKRDVNFDEDSNPDERERMLGFVVASMLSPGADPFATSPARAPEVHPPEKEREPDIPEQPAARPEHFVGMVELLGAAATGIGGPGSDYGAELAAGWLFAPTLSLRIAFGLRRGELAQANANTELELIGLGLGVTLPIGGSRFTVGGHGGPLLLRHEVTRLPSNTLPEERKSRLIAGADAGLEAGLRFSANGAFVAGVGTELGFGRTALLIKGKQVSEIPPLRGLVELGIRAQF